MKKTILALTFSFAFIFSANAVNIAPDCTALALKVGDAYENAGYDEYSSWQAANWAYEGCISDGGIN